MIDYIIAIIVLHNIIISFSQSPYENHKRYWYNKTRLNNDFLKIGIDTGVTTSYS